MKAPILTAFALLVLNVLVQAAEAKPNIVFVITDDQGYGDLGCTGNPIIQTPNLDALAAESSQLTDYHVAPTCSPTRAALLTGHWTDRTGVWHTVNGRSMLRENEITLGQLLKNHGYATGMFGDRPITAGLPAEPDVPGADRAFRAHEGAAIPVVRAALRVDGRELESKPVSGGDVQITFTAELAAGSHQLAPVFITANGDELGAYYATVDGSLREPKSAHGLSGLR